MLNRVFSALLTRRGIAALIIALVVAVLGASGGGGGAVLLFPLWLGMAWLVVGVWEASSERGSLPRPSPFTRRHSSSGMRTMLRQDRNAQFLTDNHGFLFRKRIWFEGTGCPPVRISNEQFDRLRHTQAHDPILVATSGDRRYWWWEDGFYWENEGYESLDVKALVTRSRRQKDRSLQHARALLAGERTRKRDAIPEDVRRFVWQRDGGRCQECGATELLQYDHIIPWSLGGSDTAENLRLLCTECNRLKSDSI